MLHGSKTIKKNMILIMFFIASGIFLFMRAQFGYFFNDEPFIVSLAQRLCLGDRLITDEWNTAQNFGVLLLPLYRLYIRFTGSTQGILLFFRAVYCIMWTFTCAVISLIIQKKYRGAIVVFVYLLLFAPLDQMTLSYTSVSLSCCLLIAGLFYFHFEVMPVKLWVFTVLYTTLSIVAVISLPYLAVIYAGSVLLTGVLHLKKKNQTTGFFFRMNLLSCVLCAAVALVYLYNLILRDNTVDQILLNLQFILGADSRPHSLFIEDVLNYIRLLISPWRFYAALTAVSVLLLQLPQIRKNPKRKYVLFLINVVAFLAVICRLAIQCYEPNFNMQMVPVVFLGLLAFFMLDDYKQYKTLFISFVVFGCLYSFSFFYASDTGTSAVSMGMSVCGVASVVFIAELGKQFRQYFAGRIQSEEPGCTDGNTAWVKLTAIILAVVFCGQLGVQMLLKLERHYWDVPVREMSQTISVGAGKGIRTGYHYKQQYEDQNDRLHQLLENVNMQKKSDVIFLSMISNPVLYLDAEISVGCFSTWTFMDDELLISQLNRYYQMNPAQKPNVIFGKADDARLHRLDLEIADFCVFTDGEYNVWVSPDFVNK